MDNWKRYIGIVITAPTDDTDPTLKAYCPEILPLKSGLASGTPTTIPVSINDQVLGMFTKNIPVSDTILCTYYALGFDHYATIPNVVVGEKIYIHQYVGSDVFFWMPCQETVALRKTEHLRIAIAAKTDGTQDPATDNAYYLELDSRSNKVTIHTSTQLGEPKVLDIVLDAKAGKITVSAGQTSVMLDGVKQQITLTNGSQASIDIQDSAIKIIAPIVNINEQLIIDKTNAKMTGQCLFTKLATFAAGTAGDRV